MPLRGGRGAAGRVAFWGSEPSRAVQVLPATNQEEGEKEKPRAESDTLAGLGVCQSGECARECV